MFIPQRNTPRWIILIIDLMVCVVAFFIAYLVRFEFAPPTDEAALARAFLPILLAIRLLSFLIGKTYAGIIRYTSSQDAMRIFTALTAGSAAFALLNVLRYQFYDGKYFIPYSIVILEYLLTLFSMIVSRIAVKVIYLELKTPDKIRKRAVIYGAGESGLITKQAIDRDPRSEMEVIAFIDDNPSKQGKTLDGASILSRSKLSELYATGKVDEVIIAIPSLDHKMKADFIANALAAQVHVSNIPPVNQWIGGQLSARQIRDIRIEDLLGREAIKLESAGVAAQVKNKVVLVTGAAGSIGSELVRQLLAYHPAQVVILDQAETPIFLLENELMLKGYQGKFEVVMGDVCQADRMRRMMTHFRPQIVYHAAAYKHVPLMEHNPSEAVLTNVNGTRIMADLADEFNVETFVLISTDKAVNPTNVMGATKRAAEIYVQSKDTTSQTAFVTTRFGNVLGSNGSVIPTFKKQIEEGGPLTVTHPEVTRFFMTIPEAVQLVLEAGAMSNGGEIFAFDMGESVKVRDLAENMIKLSGLEPGKDIEIIYTGLRPGEKLYEEVLSAAEGTVPTHHPKILRAKVREYNFSTVADQIQELVDLFDEQNNEKIVRKLKALVPEFVSRNSIYSQLDGEK
ncbi:MAG: polysaccharide biosynthesis protein [Flavobacteriales bacterium]